MLRKAAGSGPWQGEPGLQGKAGCVGFPPVFIPVRDINPTRTTPIVTYVIIAANILVWLWQLSLQVTGRGWLEAGYSVVPVRLTGDPTGESFTILTSMFMHANLAHIGGNMLFLYIFGDNVEDSLGHGRYVVFYLACGAAAALAQVLVGPGSHVPMIGASGAISGVLGAYVVLYPRAPIMVLNPVFLLWFVLGPLLVFPAWLAIGMWFFWNLLGGLGSLAGQGGMVAFFAHLGGFAAGLMLIRPWMRGRQRRQAKRWEGWQRPRRPPPRGDGGGQHPDPWDPPDRYH